MSDGSHLTCVYNSEFCGPRDIKSAIEKIGFQAVLHVNRKKDDFLNQASEIKQFVLIISNCRHSNITQDPENNYFYYCHKLENSLVFVRTFNIDEVPQCPLSLEIESLNVFHFYLKMIIFPTKSGIFTKLFKV